MASNVKAKTKKQKQSTAKKGGNGRRQKSAAAIVQIRQRPPRRRARNNNQAKIAISECTLKYGRAMADPWSEAAMNACVPVPAGLTQKVSGFIRGTANIGQQGIGFVLVSPCITNDAGTIVATNGTYNDVAVNPVDPSGVKVVGCNVVKTTNLPYTTSDLTSGEDNVPLSGRIVACGLRIWYTDKTIDMSGTSYGFRDPQHNTVQYFDGNYTDVAYFGSRRETLVSNHDRSQRMIVDFACVEEENEMVSFPNEAKTNGDPVTKTLYPFSFGKSSWLNNAGAYGPLYTGPGTTGPVIAVPTMAFVVKATPGTIFNFEYMIHVEYAGSRVASLGTRVVPDLEGAARMREAMAETTVTGQDADSPSLWSRLTTTYAQISEAAKSYGVPIGQFAVRGAQMYAQHQRAQRGGIVFREL